MHKVLVSLLTGLLCLWATLPLRAITAQEDSVGKALLSHFLDAYSTDSAQAFHQAAIELMAFYHEHGLTEQYYKVQMNIALYDLSHEQPYEALKRANSMLDEMKAQGHSYYDMMYAVLGTVYEQRGNYRMAEYYFREAISNTNPNDPFSMANNQARMAYLLMLYNPEEANRWNELYRDEAQHNPIIGQLYLFIKGIIHLAQNERADFLNTLSQYERLQQEHPELGGYGSYTMRVAQLAFAGNYGEALTLLQSPDCEIDQIARHDMRIIIMQRMGHMEQALHESHLRTLTIDSLNSAMLFNNLNELNAATDVAKAKHKAAQEWERMLIMLLLLATLLIAVLALWGFKRRKARLALAAKNEQLRSALIMAEESDRMKTEFVRSVSHEIRTPLNAISGFNEVVNNPDISLSPDERLHFVSRIKENVQAITGIIDEMLHMAEKESNQFYQKTDTICCNQYLSPLLHSYRNRAGTSVQLIYTTEVLDSFSIQTHAEGFRLILNHLLQNAVKFTSHGSITLHCQETDEGVLISVTDTGCGVQPENQDRIFQQFYKADTFQQGIGLGLTVSKKIAQKLGGDLILDKAYTRGARFILQLPLA